LVEVILADDGTGIDVKVHKNPDADVVQEDALDVKKRKR